MPRVYRKSTGPQITKSVILFFGLIFLISSIFYIFLTPGSAGIKVGKIVNPIGQIIVNLTSPLGRLAQKDLLDRGGQYAVVIKNLKTGEEYSLNKDQEFHSASLYKLWVLAVAQEQIKAGKLKPDEQLSAKKKDLDRTLQLIPNQDTTPTPADSGSQDPNSPTPPPDPVISMSVNEALNQMIKVSDNYAALLLVRKIGAKNIDDFISRQGFSESAFGSPPTTSANDIANYFMKLYDGKFTNSADMLALLKRQQINDRIPKYLPSQTVVAHKTGELEGAKHDAGIVFSQNGDYIIVLMSQTDNEAGAAENEAIYSRDVWKYFASKR